MTTFNSSKITWNVWLGDAAADDYLKVYCADGDGMLQVVVYADRIELQDQLDACYVWPADGDMTAILEAAQFYLSATYPDIFIDAMHWNDTLSTDELRAEMNSVNGYGYLNNKG